LVPFFIWNLFWILFEFSGTALLPSYFEGNIATGYGDWLIALFGIPFGKAPFYTPLWFVRDLFLLNLIAPILKWIIDRFPVWLTMLILAGIWLIPLPYEIWYFMCQGIVFFTLGGLIARHKVFLPSNGIVKSISILSLTVLASVACIPGINMWSYYSRFMLILAMIVICMAPIVFNLKCLEIFVPYSFMIYVLHGKVLSVLQILYARLIPQSDLTIIIGYLIIPSIIVALCIVVAYILKRFVPRFYRILMGAR